MIYTDSLTGFDLLIASRPWVGHYFGPFNPVEAGNFAQLRGSEELSEG